MEEEISFEFIDQSLKKMLESEDRILKCLKMLSFEQINYRPNENSNSVANIVVHLCGNITQYILSGLGRIEDERNRDAEFDTSLKMLESELTSKFKNTLFQAKEILKNMEAHNLTKAYNVQGFDLSGLAIILHVVEHLSYHTGQITYITKAELNKQTDYYAGKNLNIKNIIK